MRRKRKAAAEPVETDETKEVKTKPEKLPKGVKALNPKTMLPIIFRVTFKEACEMFGWKSFSFEMGGQTVVPVWCDKGADEV